MSEVALSASTRSTGKKSAKAIRRSGNVPGVFYVNGSSPVSIEVSAKALRPVVYTKDARIVNLSIQGESTSHNCLLKDITFDPVTDKILHFDLHGFSANALVEFDVPVRIIGQSIGVREGGVIDHILHKLTVKCLPSNLPEHIDVDITNLRLGNTIRVSDISVANVAFLTKADLAVVSIHLPRAAGDTPTEIVEPELVGQKGKKDDK